jgi:hypothetical protein
MQNRMKLYSSPEWTKKKKKKRIRFGESAVRSGLVMFVLLLFGLANRITIDKTHWEMGKQKGEEEEEEEIDCDFVFYPWNLSGRPFSSRPIY